MKPNFFIIGAPKCGTSSLAAYLADHPQVFFSKIKEPWYWGDDSHENPHEFGLESLRDYLKLFDEASEKHKAIGEGSTNYLRSKTAVKNILAFQHSAKFIVMLRNPVEAVQAFHMERLYSLKTDIDGFEEAWRDDVDSFQNTQPGSRNKNNGLGEAFKFATQLDRLFNVVDRERVLVIIMDDLKKNPLEVYKKTLSFLDLEYDGREVFPVVNSAHAHRWVWLAKFWLTPPRLMRKPVSLLRIFLINHRFSGIERFKKFLNKKITRPQISSSLQREIKEYYKSDVHRLSAILDRDLCYWVE